MLNRLRQVANHILPSPIGEGLGVRLFVLSTLLLSLTSCGELFDMVDDVDPVGQLTLRDRAIDLMVGDRYVLPATLEPDSLPDKSLYWESRNPEVVSITADTLVAVAPGEAVVCATSVTQLISDSCVVTVHPYWSDVRAYYQYDMVVFANVTVAGRPMDEHIMVGAFNEEGQLCGVGEQHEANGIRYMLLRIYSAYDETEDITLRCYDRLRAKMSEWPQTILFNGGTLGTLSSLYQITFE